VTRSQEKRVAEWESVRERSDKNVRKEIGGNQALRISVATVGKEKEGQRSREGAIHVWIDGSHGAGKAGRQIDRVLRSIGMEMKCRNDQIAG